MLTNPAATVGVDTNDDSANANARVGRPTNDELSSQNLGIRRRDDIQNKLVDMNLQRPGANQEEYKFTKNKYNRHIPPTSSSCL